MDHKAGEKKERLLQALDKGMVMIHLDARRAGVLVPPSLRGEAHLRLNLSYRFDPPDLSVGDWGVRSTLSFSGTRFTVAVPWSSLFAITSHVTKEFWMYPDDMPEELIQQPAAGRGDGPSATGAGPDGGNGLFGRERNGARGILREVVSRPDPDPAPAPAPARQVDAPAAESKPPEGPGDEPPRPRGRGHLRVVK
jgi:stringent starvation protein B